MYTRLQKHVWLRVVGLLLLCLSWSQMVIAQRVNEPSLPVRVELCKHEAFRATLDKAKALQATQAIQYPSGYFNYYIHHYTLHTWPKPSNGSTVRDSIIGSTDFHFKPTGRLDTLVFDLSTALTLDSVKFQGRAIAATRHPRYPNLILAPLGSAARSIDTLSVWYRGTPQSSGFGSVSFSPVPFQSGRYFYTLSEPYGARDWWALRQDYNQKVDSIDILVATTEPNYVGVSNGLLVDTLYEGTKTIWHWKHKYPFVFYQIAVESGPYVYGKDTVALQNGILLLENFCFAREAATWQRNFSITKNQLHTFEGMFGAYPFWKEKYGHVQFGFGGGMEHQTNSSMADTEFFLQSHELGHQWFGNLVTCKGMGEIWLNEGFASYLEYLALPQSDFTARRGWMRNAHAASLQLPTQPIFKYDTANVSNVFSYVTTYRRPGQLVHMIRKTLGDAAFFSGIRNYLADTALAYNFVRTGNLEQHLSRAAGRNMAPFFDAWVMQGGYPLFNMSQVQASIGTVSFALSQTSTRANGPFYAGKVPVLIYWSNATIDTVWADHTTNSQVFTFQNTSGATADSLILNGNYEYITPLVKTVVPPVPVGIDKSVAAGRLTIWPNPAQDMVYVTVPDMATAHHARLTVSDASGRVVHTQPVQGAIHIPIYTWPGGVYQLSLATEKAVWHAPLIKP